ncbi:MAG: ABC transporter ATP-binding protein [Clostridia bacterium]|nr:ABC transporter ATP-binding protein [Clostridia bacterium]
MEYAIRINNVSKRYKKTEALNELNLMVPKGSVYGFLGRNGAGKTTTIRIITRLIKKDKGEVYVLGSDAQENRAQTMQNIGAIVESPAFYRNLTGRQNLKIAADLFGADKSRIEDVIKIADISDYADRKVKAYSTGMKQRLGIAAALVHSPKILILDEPTNGLDPAGVKDLRKLIKDLSKNLKITILVSSHILSEVEQIADYVGILHEGRLMDEFSMDDINLGEQKYLLLETDSTEKAAKILNENKDKLNISSVSQGTGKNQLKIFCGRDANAQINSIMASNNVIVSGMSSVKNTLEERFFAVTGSSKVEMEGI